MCNIYKEKDDMLNLSPKYHVYCFNNKRYLISAKKKSFKLCSNYIISMNKNDCSENSNSYLGKLTSDFLGLVFNAFDNGKNYKEAKSSSDIRKILVTAQYVCVILFTL